MTLKELKGSFITKIMFLDPKTESSRKGTSDRGQAEGHRGMVLTVYLGMGAEVERSSLQSLERSRAFRAEMKKTSSDAKKEGIAKGSRSFFLREQARVDDLEVIPVPRTYVACRWTAAGSPHRPERPYRRVKTGQHRKVDIFALFASL
jgi:hypothetical protein